MKIQEVISKYLEQDIIFKLKNGGIEVLAYEGVLNDELLAEIKTYKQEIIQYLQDDDFVEASSPSVEMNDPLSFPIVNREAPLSLSFAQETSLVFISVRRTFPYL